MVTLLLVTRAQQAAKQLVVGIDEGEVDAWTEPAVDGVEEQRRRVTRADLDHPTRPHVTQHGVEDGAVAPRVGRVVEPVAVLVAPLGREGQVDHEWGKDVEQGQLLALAQVDGGRVAGGLEQAVGALLEVGQVGVGRVVVPGRHPGAVPLLDVPLLQHDLVQHALRVQLLEREPLACARQLLVILARHTRAEAEEAVPKRARPEGPGRLWRSSTAWHAPRR
jgi:hypothetical protein